MRDLPPVGETYEGKESISRNSEMNHDRRNLTILEALPTATLLRTPCLPLLGFLACAFCVATSGCGGSSQSRHMSALYANLLAYDIDYDQATSSAYAATQTGTQGVVQLSVRAPIKMTNVAATITGAWLLATASDGKSLFVVCQTGASYEVEQLVLSTDTVTPVFSVPSGQTPVEIQGLPHSPNGFVIDTVNAGAYETSVVNSSSAQSSDQIGSTFCINPKGNQLYGLNPSTGMYAVATISSSGLTVNSMVSTTLTTVGNNIHWANGKIVTDDGHVLDPTSGTVLAKLSFPANTTESIAAPINGTNNVRFVVESPGQASVVTFDLSKLAQVGTPFQVTSDPPLSSLSLTKAVSTGSHSLDILAGSPSSQTSQIVEVLGQP